MPSRRTTSSQPVPPSPSPPPSRPPLRSRRKSKSPSSRSNRLTPKRALDLDKIGVTSGPEDARQTRGGSRDLRCSPLDRKREGVASELRHCGSRTRSTVYHTSDLPSMVTARRQLEQSEAKGHTERSKTKATFV